MRNLSITDLNRMLNDGWSTFDHYYPLHAQRSTPRPGTAAISPFPRANGLLEKAPSFSLYWNKSKGTFYFKDAGLDLMGTHWDFVCALFKVSFKDAVAMVKQDVLGMLTENSVPIIRTPTVNYSIGRSIKKTIIEPKYRELNADDLNFFGKAGIDAETLDLFHWSAASETLLRIEEDGEVREYNIKARNGPMYVIDFPSGRRKIYQPLHPKPGNKWMTNLVAAEDVFGLDTIPQTGKNEHVFLIGGNRDTASFRKNIGLPSIALSSESANITPNFYFWLRTHYKHIWGLYDNDRQGWKKAEQFRVEHAIPPLNGIYQEFEGGNEDGTANDFCNMIENPKNSVHLFKEKLFQRINQ